jgi:hypothetical protein
MYTDPWCPFSWAAEPHSRRMQVEFGESLSITYVMGGMQQALSKVPEFAGKWLEASDRSGMPVDPRRLLSDPPASTHPAGIAFKAWAELGRPEPFLRRLREAVFLERRTVDRPDELLALAMEVKSHVDRSGLSIGFGSHAVLEHYGADLERSEGMELPTLEVDGRREPAPERWRELLLSAGAEPAGEWPLEVEEAVRRFGPVATAEIAQLCDLPGPRAEAELWRLATEWRVRPRRVLFGEMWERA